MFAYGDRACLYARGVAAAELENASIFRYERVTNVVSVAYCDGALGDLKIFTSPIELMEHL